MGPQRNRNLITFLIMLLVLQSWLPQAAIGVGASQAPKPTRADLIAYKRLKGRQVTLFDQWTAEQNKKDGTSLHPATLYASLTPSQRSTYEAVTHALSRSRLTDDGGRPLRPSALDLVTTIDAVAGHVKGARGDLQFRLYVQLVTDAQDVLTGAREFFRDKDNKVFHKDFPNNFRQRGRVPSIQISIAKDGTHADIDVDYRSSRPPKSLVNGHLRAANSDVRVGGNYLGHVGRWFGLIRWWRIILDPTEETEPEGTPATSRPASAQAPNKPTAPSPVVPAATLMPEQIVDAQEVTRAMHDFLTTWLIKRDRRRADDYLTKRPVACINIDEDQENETVSGQLAIREFALLLDVGLKAKGKLRTLEGAVAAVEPWDPELALIDHPYKSLFALRAVQRDWAAEFMCESSRLAGDPDAYGQFYQTIFILKLAKESGGGLDLLWTKEDGQWQIISYDILEP